jgi:putative transposase
MYLPYTIITDMEYKSNSKQVYLINYHLVWCPQRRKKVLVGKVKNKLEEIIKQVANDKQVEIIALEIMPDHLHLFVSTYPQLEIHKLVKAFKGRSSNILRKEYPELKKIPSMWTRSYFVSTAGNVSSETIQKYI